MLLKQLRNHWTPTSTLSLNLNLLYLERVLCSVAMGTTLISAQRAGCCPRTPVAPAAFHLGENKLRWSSQVWRWLLSSGGTCQGKLEPCQNSSQIRDSESKKRVCVCVCVRERERERKREREKERQRERERETWFPAVAMALGLCWSLLYLVGWHLRTQHGSAL